MTDPLGLFFSLSLLFCLLPHLLFLFVHGKFFLLKTETAENSLLWADIPCIWWVFRAVLLSFCHLPVLDLFLSGFCFDFLLFFFLYLLLVFPLPLLLSFHPASFKVSIREDSCLPSALLVFLTDLPASNRLLSSGRSSDLVSFPF